MNNKGQVSAWGLIYGIVCLVIAIIITKAMHPGWFWSAVTIVVTTGGGYFFGMKASGEI